MNEYHILRKTPILRFLFIFIVGIVLTKRYSDFISNYSFLIISVSCILFFLFFITLYFKSSGRLSDIVIPILVLNISVLITLNTLPSEINVDSVNEKYQHAEIYKYPELRKNSMLIPAKIKLKTRLGTYQYFKINIYTNSDSVLLHNIATGEKIYFRGSINKIKNYGNPYELDMELAMASKGIFFQAWVKSEDILLRNKSRIGFNFSLIIENIRHGIEKQVDKYVKNPDSRALIMAFITGDRQDITDEMENAYIHAGVIHILSVSGLHIGIIFMIFHFLLRPMDKNRKLKIIKTLLIISAVWFYALISGLSTSVTRSALMFSLISIGLSFRRDISFYNILAASALFMLFFNPLQLYDVGFQLSYLAVAGIVFFQPRLNNLFGFSNTVLNYIYQLLIVSLSAQLATFPLLLYYFHQFPVYFWLANLLVIPVTFVLMMLIVVFLITSFIPISGLVFGIVCSWIAWILNKTVILFENIPGSMIERIFISKAEVILIFLLIATLTYWLETKRFRGLVFGLAIINLFIVLKLSTYQSSSEKEFLIVYNTPGATVLGFKAGSGFVLFSDNIDENSLSKIKFHCNGHWNHNSRKELNVLPFDSILYQFPARQTVPGNGNYIFGINDSSKIILMDKHLSEFPGTPLTSDGILIVAGNFWPPRINKDFSKIVLSPGMNRFYAANWEKYAKENKIDLFNIKKEGAFVLGLKN